MNIYDLTQYVNQDVDDTFDVEDIVRWFNKAIASYNLISPITTYPMSVLDDDNAGVAVSITTGNSFGTQIPRFLTTAPTNGVTVGVVGQVYYAFSNDTYYSCTTTTTTWTTLSIQTDSYPASFINGEFYEDTRTNKTYLWNNATGTQGQMTADALAWDGTGQYPSHSTTDYPLDDTFMLGVVLPFISASVRGQESSMGEKQMFLQEYMMNARLFKNASNVDEDYLKIQASKDLAKYQVGENVYVSDMSFAPFKNDWTSSTTQLPEFAEEDEE
jgi:hypothetical protein